MKAVIKIVLVLLISVSIVQETKASDDLKIVARNISSNHVFFEFIDTANVIEKYNLRIDGCKGTSKHVKLHNDITKKYYNVSDLFSDAVYIAMFDITRSVGGPYKETITFKTPSTSGPSKIANLHASAITSNSITVTWDAIFNVSTYQVQRSPGSSYTHNGNETMYEFTGLTANTDYTINVNTNTEGRTILADEIKVKTLINDNEPRDVVVVSAYDDSFDLHWKRAKSDNSITYTITGADLKHTYTTDQNYQKVEVADKSKMTASFTIGSITKTVTLSSNKRPHIMNVWAPYAYNDSLTIQWDNYPGAMKYTVAYWKKGNSPTTKVEVPDVMSDKVMINSLDPDTEYEIEVRTLVRYSAVASEITTIRTQKNTIDSVINIMVVDNFNKSVTLRWSHSIRGMTSLIYVLKSTSLVNSYSTDKNEQKLDNVGVGMANIDVNLTEINNVQTATNIHGSIQVNVPENDFVEGVTIEDISAKGFKIKWKKLRHFVNYRVYYYESTISSTMANQTSVSGYTKDIYALKSGTQYSVWVETEEQGSPPIRSLIINATTLAQDAANMGAIMLVNAFARSFDIKWNVYPQATYGVKCSNIVDDKEYYVPMATISTSNIGNRNYTCFVYVKKLRGVAVTPPESINTTSLDITLPSYSGTRRPTLNLWVIKQNLSVVHVGWNAIDKQATFAINQDCCGAIQSFSTLHAPIGGLNSYMTMTMSPSEVNALLKNGGSCSFSVLVNSIDNTPYYFDYKSNELRIDFHSNLQIVPEDTDGPTDGGDGSSAVSLQTCVFLSITTLLTALLISM